MAVKLLQKNIGFEFEIATNLSKRKLSTAFRKATGFNKVTVTDDCSIEHSSTGYRYGLEIQTAPQPAGKAHRNLKKAFKFFQEQDISTNDSTGLHVNISFQKKGYNNDISAGKLQMLTDDIKWLKRFDRLDNIYTITPKLAIAEVIDKIKKRKRLGPPDEIINTLKEASSIWNIEMNEMNIRENSVNITKLELINPYVEFRILGGLNYHWRTKEVLSATDHFSRAMDMSLGNRYDYLYKRYIERMHPTIETSTHIPH
tara:strand:+ start:615 stop:1385 length:771 start_codon:yes stop_codon:yes gene_type:complete